MIRTMNGAGENFVRLVSEHLDLRVLMTFLAIGNYLADWDGFLGDFGMNNFYLARFEPRTFAPFIPWDKDTVMVADPAHPSRAIEWSILHNVSENVLARGAIAAPELRGAFFTDVLRAADAADGWMEAELARQFALIRDAAVADSFKPYSNDEFIEGAQYLFRFARERPAVVRCQVAASR